MTPFWKITSLALLLALIAGMLALFYSRTEISQDLVAQPELPSRFYCDDPTIDVPLLPPEEWPQDPAIPRYYHCCAEETEQRILESRTVWGEEGEIGVDTYAMTGDFIEHIDRGGSLPPQPAREVNTHSCRPIHPEFFFEYVEDTTGTLDWLRSQEYYQ